VDVCLHDHAVLPPVAPLARAEGDDVHRWTLGLVLEVVAIEGGGGVGFLLEECGTWKHRNRHTNGRTHMYIS
jgi:hypothetical protein